MTRRSGTLVRPLLVALGVLAAGVAIADADAVTFTRDVAPLLQQHCQECHRPGGGAPFALSAYEHVYHRRDKILESVEKRLMPPWKARPGYGDLAGERRLSDAEISTLRRWVAGGAPEGDPGDLPPPRAFAATAVVGTPDLVLRPEQDFTVPARAGDMYRCFSIATSFPEDRYFTAAEVVPGNSKIVHHVLAMVDPDGVSAPVTARDGLRGYPCFGGPGFKIDGYLGGWSPGARPWQLPEGVGMLLPKGARVVFQLHYHNPRLTAETDWTELHLRLAKVPVQRRMLFMRVGKMALTIPAGEARHEIEAGALVHRPMRLIAIHPHMHLLGREMKVWARMPNDAVTPLIHIDDWDFNWQGFYFYRTPVALPPGSWIELSAAWDNSERNPRNPNRPPRDVFWGERTIDEMGHAAILYTFDD
ncbi:MAG TPA: ascorbate-dependent monooxygenase [Methylomirabilota bacterium]|nr:ascorbate-dependent monooxygenase [Methylomirabilota bacterium]